MTVGFRDSSGTDIDSLLAPWTSGMSQVAATGFKDSSGNDLNTHYAPASYGSAYGTTDYTVSNGNYAANTDIGNIFAKAGSLITPYTVYAINGGSGVSYATSVSGSASDATTTFSSGYNGNYGMINKNGGSSLPNNTWYTSYNTSAGANIAMPGSGTYTFPSGTWTFNMYVGNSVGTFEINVNVFFYNGSTYASIGNLTSGSQSATGSKQLITVSGSLSSATINVGSGEGLYLLLQMYCSSATLPGGSAYWYYGSGNGTIVTPGYT